MPAAVVIDSDAALARLIPSLARQRAIAIDTESNPLFAYRERLCLLQISTPTHDYVIDPLAGVDLSLLSAVLADPGIVKVLHDAEFDVLMLRRVHPFEVSSLFDTKVAAQALGLERVGLAPMLEQFFDVTLDKRLQRSDWGHRPLSPDQLDYAARDTHHLLRMAAELRRRLHEAGEPAMLEVAAECRRLCALAPEAKRFDPDEFTRIRGAEWLDPVSRRALRELFALREELAERRDSPPFKVLGNEMLLQVARRMPVDREALAGVRALPVKLAQRYGERILDAVRRARRLGPLAAPPAAAGDADGLGPRERETYDALRAWRKRRALERPTEVSLILGRANLVALARLRRPPRDLGDLARTGRLEPWRLQLYGEELLQILRGRPEGDDDDDDDG